MVAGQDVRGREVHSWLWIVIRRPDSGADEIDAGSETRRRGRQKSLDEPPEYWRIRLPVSVCCPTWLTVRLASRGSWDDGQLDFRRRPTSSKTGPSPLLLSTRPRSTGRSDRGGPAGGRLRRPPSACLVGLPDGGRGCGGDVLGSRGSRCEQCCARQFSPRLPARSQQETKSTAGGTRLLASRGLQTRAHRPEPSRVRVMSTTAVHDLDRVGCVEGPRRRRWVHPLPQRRARRIHRRAQLHVLGARLRYELSARREGVRRSRQPLRRGRRSWQRRLRVPTLSLRLRPPPSGRSASTSSSITLGWSARRATTSAWSGTRSSAAAVSRARPRRRSTRSRVSRAGRCTRWACSALDAAGNRSAADECADGDVALPRFDRTVDSRPAHRDRARTRRRSALRWAVLDRQRRRRRLSASTATRAALGSTASSELHGLRPGVRQRAIGSKSRPTTRPPTRSGTVCTARVRRPPATPPPARPGDTSPPSVPDRRDHHLARPRRASRSVGPPSVDNVGGHRLRALSRWGFRRLIRADERNVLGSRLRPQLPTLRSTRATRAATAPHKRASPPRRPRAPTPSRRRLRRRWRRWAPRTRRLRSAGARRRDDVGVAGYGVYLGGRTRRPRRASRAFTFTGLACGSTYTVGVDAYDAAGSRSASAPSWSSRPSACADTDASLGTPTGLVTSGVTALSMSLAWNASTDNVGVTGYGVYLAGVRGRHESPRARTHSPVSLCGTTYALGVDAVDAAGNRSARASLSGTTSACGLPPIWGWADDPARPVVADRLHRGAGEQHPERRRRQPRQPEPPRGQQEGHLPRRRRGRA